MSYRIRQNSSDSVKAVDKDAFVDVELRQTAKIVPYPSVSTIINQREVYEKERNECKKFRFILTITPYCSNVLFNALTEIVRNEGSPDVEVVDEKTNGNAPTAIGTTEPTRVHMISNTEYSSLKHGGYEYHPGFDIFDNHILRNKTFKMVNQNPNDRTTFNTLWDKMRTYAGGDISFGKRKKNDNNPEWITGRHLYFHDDIMEISDSINNNLTEENGWWGFVNNTTVEGKKGTGDSVELMDIGRVLNNHKPCEFIDMYPDRTLYSFNPKYNKHRHRPEYNWHVVITYPYKNVYDNDLVSETVDGNVANNRLKIHSAKVTTSLSMGKNIVFRTYTKHGLNRGDMVYIYYNGTESRRAYRVTNVGNLGGGDQEYYFYISDIELMQEIYTSVTNNTDNIIGDDGNFVADFDVSDIEDVDYRMCRYKNGIRSQYYVRMFRRVPNFVAKQREMTDEEKTFYAKMNGAFEDYVRENADSPKSRGKQRLFANEQYQLAFAANIFNDNKTQITFTDGVDVTDIKDNLGRPVTELYYTIVKNNAGHKKWYSGEGRGDADVEFSHCFGNVTCGFDMLCDDNTDEKFRDYHSARHIYETNGCLDGSELIGDDVREMRGQDYTDINYEDTFFYGDLTEFIPSEYKEVTLGDIMHRFNTAQRELGKNERYSEFQFHEIIQDDWDLNEFKVVEFSAANGALDDGKQDEPDSPDNDGVNDGLVVNANNPTDEDVIYRPEGYVYKAHYKVPIRTFGYIQQDSHYAISFDHAKPVQRGGIFIQITTAVRNTIGPNATIMLYDEEHDKRYMTRCTYVIDNYNFLIDPNIKKVIEHPHDIYHLHEGDINAVNTDFPHKWLDICDKLNDGSLVARSLNEYIPDYAVYVGNNRYLWREVENAGESINQGIDDYIFANGYFYVTTDINFFLKRQDPFGKIGLQFTENDGFPNDISGTQEPASFYEIKEPVGLCGNVSFDSTDWNPISKA